MLERTLSNIQVDLIDEPRVPSRITIEEHSLTELAHSILRLGLLEPIGLQPIGDGPRYQLVYGHRRLRAVRHLGWYTIPAVILPATLSEAEARQHENAQRVQLTPVEEAQEIRRWLDSGQSLHNVASILGKSETWVAQRQRLLRYPDDVLGAVHVHGLALAVADQLARIEHDGYRRQMLDEAIRHGATAAVASAWVQHYEANRPRLEANTDTVEQIAQERHSYRIVTPCEYCGSETDLQSSRVWRLCPPCTQGLQQAQTTRAS